MSFSIPPLPSRMLVEPDPSQIGRGLDLGYIFAPVTTLESSLDFLRLAVQNLSQALIAGKIPPDLFLNISAPIFAEWFTGSEIRWNLGMRQAQQCLYYLKTIPPLISVGILSEMLLLNEIADISVFGVAELFPEMSFTLSRPLREQWSLVLHQATRIAEFHNLSPNIYRCQATENRVILTVVLPQTSSERPLSNSFGEVKYLLRTAVEKNCSWNPKKPQSDDVLVWATEALRVSHSRLSRTALALPSNPCIWIVLYLLKDHAKTEF